jgi:hypothetical protein
MKKVFFLMYTFLVLGSIYAQSPEAFNYQGIARDVIGTPLPNTNISLRISIIQDTPSGTTAYSENHFILTNKLGLFNIEVGHGSNPTGQFSDIKWGMHNHYIQIEMDESGGTNFQFLGTSQLLSVPYALYAANGKWLDNSKGIHYIGGNVGIGTDNPIDKLTILGNDPMGDARYYLSLNNLSTSNRSYAMMRLSAGQPNSYTYLSHHSESYDFDGNKYTDFGQLESTGRGLIL